MLVCRNIDWLPHGTLTSPPVTMNNMKISVNAVQRDALDNTWCGCNLTLRKDTYISGA